MLRRFPALDLIRAQDVAGIAGLDDRSLLAWATDNQRVLLTHDLATMVPAFLVQRQDERGCTPIVLVSDSLPIGAVIDEILLLEQCSEEADWAAGGIYLPLR